MQSSQQTHPIVQAMRNLVSRFTQSPNVYDIKFYKKTANLKRLRRAYK